MTYPVARPLLRRWTKEEEAEVVRLREQTGMTWSQIGEKLARTGDAVESKYLEIKKGIVRDRPIGRPKAKKPSEFMHPPWSEDDMAYAQRRWQELFVEVFGERAPVEERKRIFTTIGHELNRTGPAVENRLRVYGASFGLKWGSVPLTSQIADEIVLAAARPRLEAYARQDPISRMLGDPPPGWSALDRLKPDPEPKRILNNRIAPNVTLPDMEISACGGSGPTLSNGTNA